jgi:hypothetical protein
MKLKYVGPTLSTGEPERSLIFEGIPAGDVDDGDLTPEQVKTALKSGLYEWATPPEKRAAAKKKAAAKSDAPKKAPARKKPATPPASDSPPVEPPPIETEDEEPAFAEAPAPMPVEGGA